MSYKKNLDEHRHYHSLLADSECSVMWPQHTLWWNVKVNPFSLNWLCWVFYCSNHKDNQDNSCLAVSFHVAFLFHGSIIKSPLWAKPANQVKVQSNDFIFSWSLWLNTFIQRRPLLEAPKLSSWDSEWGAVQPTITRFHKVTGKLIVLGFYF